MEKLKYLTVHKIPQPRNLSEIYYKENRNGRRTQVIELHRMTKREAIFTELEVGVSKYDNTERDQLLSYIEINIITLL